MEKTPTYTSEPFDVFEIAAKAKEAEAFKDSPIKTVSYMFFDTFDMPKDVAFKLFFEEALDWKIGMYVINYLANTFKRGKKPKDGILWVGLDNDGTIYFAAGKTPQKWRKVG